MSKAFQRVCRVRRTNGHVSIVHLRTQMNDQIVQCVVYQEEKHRRAMETDSYFWQLLLLYFLYVDIGGWPFLIDVLFICNQSNWLHCLIIFR